MAADSGKTEKATPRKREDERKKGNIFQSKDITGTLSLLLFILVLRLGGNLLFTSAKQIVVESYDSLSKSAQFGLQDATSMLNSLCLKMLMLILPIGGVAALLGVVISGVQTRFLFAGSLLKPKLSRLSPVSNLKNVFSRRSLVELLKASLKIIIIGSILYTEINSRLAVMVQMPLIGPESSFYWIGEATFSVAVKLTLFMTLLSVLDYVYQWWDYEQKLKMTKQEVKEELKRMEGDPQIKSRIKEIQRKLSVMRMMHKVPFADVVIKNPTHYAVALKYDPKKDRAPVLVAKGADLLALRIIKVAEENGVYVTENKPLARGLYEAVKLDQQIPEEFYKPVADVIAFIYNLKKRR